MDRDEAFKTFQAAAVEVLRVKEEQVVPDAGFADDLDADSLDLVEFVMKLEEDFDVEIDESELEGVTKVQQAFDLLVSKLP
jgi:acyl carrier protein